MFHDLTDDQANLITVLVPMTRGKWIVGPRDGIQSYCYVLGWFSTPGSVTMKDDTLRCLQEIEIFGRDDCRVSFDTFLSRID